MGQREEREIEREGERKTKTKTDRPDRQTDRQRQREEEEDKKEREDENPKSCGSSKLFPMLSKLGSADMHMTVTGYKRMLLHATTGEPLGDRWATTGQ